MPQTSATPGKRRTGTAAAVLVAVVVAALLASILGFWGFIEEFPIRSRAPNSSIGVVILNNLFRTISLFFVQADLSWGPDNWKLALARVLGPAATAGVIIELVLAFLGGSITRLRARVRRNHTIVVGCGERGQYFVCNCKNNPNDKLVVIDRSSDLAIAQHACDAKALFVRGDARNPGLLESVGLARAQQLIVLGGDDAQNLEIVSAAQRVKRKRAAALKVLVRIDDPRLVRQLDREDRFVHRPGCDVTAFNIAAVTARGFLQAHPLVDHAEIRAQGRIHLVCVGWTPFVFAVLEQLARLSPFRKYPAPVVHLFVEREKAARSELDAVQPALRDILDLRFADLDDASNIPTPGQMEAIEPGPDSSVTAVLVSIGNDAETAAAALAIRDRSQQSGRWRAPLYAHLGTRGALSDLLGQRSGEPRPGSAVVPVGFHEDACRTDALFGEREDLAKQIHDSYLAFKGIDDLTPAGQRSDSDQPWTSLKQTYRLACRRAADHFPIKLLSVGAMQTGTPAIAAGNLGFATSQEQLEALADLEHQSWVIDRRLDGWRPGTHRDNEARIHPAMIPYADLTEDVKDFDRDQIRAIAQHLLREGRAPTVKRETRIGIIGHNQVSSEDKAHMLLELDRTIMPKIIKTHENDFVSICTPLAPGADTILTEAVLARLKEAGIDHSLVVVRSLPLQVVIDDFEPNFVTGYQWRFEDDSPSFASWSEAKAQMTAHLDALPETARNACVADLIPAGRCIDDFVSTPTLKTNAYQRAAAWLVERCDALLAFHDPGREGGRGGTRQTLQWAQGLALPADHSTLHPREEGKLPRLFVIEP